MDNEIKHAGEKLDELIELFMSHGGREEIDERLEMRQEPLAFACLVMELLATEYKQNEWGDAGNDGEEAFAWRETVLEFVRKVYILGLFDANYIELPSEM